MPSSLSSKISLYNINFNISDKINEICESILLFNKIHIFPYENTISPGTGRIEFKNSEPEIVIGINMKYVKFTEQILSHELLHFKLASDRNFIFGFDNNFNVIASLILSAFEHPLIIDIQKSIGINVFDFIKKDIDHNLSALKNKIKSKNITTKDLILWADRFCWGVFPSKIKIAKQLIKSLHDTEFEVINRITLEINSYKSNQDPQSLVSFIDTVFNFLDYDNNYEIKYIKE